MNKEHTFSPELVMINNEINKIITKDPISDEDLKRLESLIKMRQMIQDKPAIIYVKDFSEVYDRTILSTLNQAKLPPSKKKAYIKKKYGTENKEEK
jgi:uridylate kinase